MKKEITQETPQKKPQYTKSEEFKVNLEAYTENEQNKIIFKEEYELLINNVIKTALKYEKFDYDCFVGVTITDNENIRLINNEQRGIDYATDVLSFPVLEFENGELKENPGDVFDGKYILGDIVISLERVLEQSKEYGHSFERELGYLVCHSVLHLLGYDHENDDERNVMREKEEAVMEQVGLTR